MAHLRDKQLKYEKALEYEIFIKGEYDFAKNEILKAETIFDIWGHIWLFSRWCRSLNSKARIYYFEPICEFYEKAKEKLWNNDKIILNNCWIASESGEWLMLLNEEKTMQSSKYSSFLNPEWRGVIVKFVSLKEYLELENINKIDVLKMDIEWMEFEVLTSFSGLEWSKIDTLVLEVHLLNDEMKLDWNNLLEIIKRHFKYVEIIDWWYCNEVFLLYAKRYI